ncbi:helix-turn-helix transcriptional regulator [Bacillus sp. BGMRC 2118]|nr:helix-turn-helix transcriptional regulator [Bacillus sp. BGMRC 2118]
MEQLNYYEVTTFEQAKVLSNDLRMKILSLFHDDKSRTAKQIADQLEMSASKIHYHVRELVKVGLLVLTETKENAGIVEKYYLPIAKDIRIRLSQIEGEGIHLLHEQSQIINNTLKEYKTCFLKAFEHAHNDPSNSKPLFFQMSKYMSVEEKSELYSELKELSEKWNNRLSSTSKDPHRKEHGLLLSLYEVIE